MSLKVIAVDAAPAEYEWEGATGRTGNEG